MGCKVRVVAVVLTRDVDESGLAYCVGELSSTVVRERGRRSAVEIEVNVWNAVCVDAEYGDCGDGLRHVRHKVDPLVFVLWRVRADELVFGAVDGHLDANVVMLPFFEKSN